MNIYKLHIPIARWLYQDLYIHAFSPPTKNQLINTLSLLHKDSNDVADYQGEWDKARDVIENADWISGRLVHTFQGTRQTVGLISMEVGKVPIEMIIIDPPIVLDNKCITIGNPGC